MTTGQAVSVEEFLERSEMRGKREGEGVAREVSREGRGRGRAGGGGRRGGGIAGMYRDGDYLWW